MSLLHAIKSLTRCLPFVTCCLIFQGIACNTLAYTPYSTDELDKLEKEFVQLINQSNHVEREPLANQYINHLGKQLAYYAKIPSPYFFIVKSNEINAFAGPGGYIGVNTQLILATHNESELAAVMAHEIAHVRLHHLYHFIQHEKQMRVPMLASLLASIALGMVNPTLGSGALMASMGGFAQNSINFTRANEKEADRIGINMLIKAGFDPKAMASFFKKMQQNARYYSANIPPILRTHPLDDDRIAEAENRIQTLRKTTGTNNLNYALFKEVIRVSVASNSKQLIDYYRVRCQKQGVKSTCHYGLALALFRVNQYSQAESILVSLLEHDPNNLYYQIAMAQAEIGHKEYHAALKRLRDLQANYPENYAAMMAYGQGLMSQGHPEQAVYVFLKGSRRFKQDLPLCEALAQAQSEAKQKDFAYFTEAQCQLLQGHKHEAIRELKLAKRLAKKNNYLVARINATIEDINFLSTD